MLNQAGRWGRGDPLLSVHHPSIPEPQSHSHLSKLSLLLLAPTLAEAEAEFKTVSTPFPLSSLPRGLFLKATQPLL